MTEAENISLKILEFIKQAGNIAINNQNKIDFSASYLKTSSVTDVVTQTDIAISNLFKTFIKNNFSDLNPLIVDEETVFELGDNPLDKISSAEYVFIIDPIDGTLPYSAQLPLYGISVGVFKHGEPYIGVEYAPALHSLVYDNGERVFAIENAFLANQTIKELKPFPDNFDNEPLFLASQTKIKLNDKWHKQDIAPIDMYSAVLNCITMAKGQARGYFFKCYLWDIAGSLSMFKKLGLKILDVKTKKEFVPLEKNTFNNKLYSKNIYIVCREKYFEYLQSIIETN